MEFLKVIVVVGAIVLPAVSQGAIRTWDGDSTNDLWSTDANWSDDTKPVGGDTVSISTGDAVLSDIGTWPGGMNVTLSGGSDVAQSGASALRMNGADLHVGAGSMLSGGFWDLGGADITFENGAAAPMGCWEQKFNNTFTFELGPTNFTTLTPGTLLIAGHNNTTMSNATYIADMANYTNGLGVITLVDFGSDGAATTPEKFQWSTRIVTNAAAYPNAVIQWDDTADAIELDLWGGVCTWNGNGADDSWTTAANWNYGFVPGSSDNLRIVSGASVTNGQNEFGTLNVESNATVSFSEDLGGANSITCAGTIERAGVWRLGGAGITLTETGRFGPNLTFLDLNGATINFHNGAAFDNTSMSFEFKSLCTLGFTLSETGFDALELGTMQNNHGNATWSNQTFNIDISAYDRNRGKTMVLMDFTAGGLAGTFGSSTNCPTVNVVGQEGGWLSWDDTNKDLILHVNPIQGSLMIVR